MTERRFIAIGNSPTTTHPWMHATHTWLQRQGQPFTAIDVAEQMLAHYDKHIARTRPNRIQRKQVLAHHAEGVSLAQIAHRLGCDESTVRYHLRQLLESA